MLPGRGFVPLQHLDLSHHAVFEHRHVVEQVKGLEHHPHMCPVLRRICPALQHVFPVVEDFSRGRSLQQVDTAQKRGFSGAGGADDADDVSVADCKIDVFQHFMRPEGFGKMVNLQNRIRHLIPPPFHRFHILCCARRRGFPCRGAGRSRLSWSADPPGPAHSCRSRPSFSPPTAAGKTQSASW